MPPALPALLELLPDLSVVHGGAEAVHCGDGRDREHGALPAVSCRESWPCLGTGRGTRFTMWFGGYQTYLWWDTNRWYVMSRPPRTAPQGAAC